MRSFLDDWARDIREEKDGKIHSAGGLWARLPVKARWKSKVIDIHRDHTDFEGEPMTLVRVPAIRCPDRDRALAAGGAAPTRNTKPPEPYYTAPQSACRKCPNRVRSRIHRNRYACALLREAAKNKPSAAKEIGDAIDNAVKTVDEIMGR